MRKSCLVPIGLQHVAEKDTTVGGHFIPKGAVLNGTIFTIHHDTRYWDNPDEFLPERWLNDEGKFVTKKEGFLPFGIGKRQCLGESLARMELFVFTTTLLQRLSFASPQGKTLNLHHDTTNPFFHLPLVQDILVSVRA
ncbi:Cytochrome P450 2L1 [Chionoecetes opilio]|uniref:Cytochrome P450 2L1 n=1 Tax=Chionoecetes opilio TaxID=41210 RepID=A0A8J4XPL0_CHIOP|nr:Cytochrome P450 2L1 [Chionoecetes opilio]